MPILAYSFHVVTGPILQLTLLIQGNPKS